ncbi:hypothetical protein OLX02_11020 [Novosphingobium sp. KCTC 2891]|uniref:hypothetical protein n=1 Tax=Novosphingobium sp. KCTC 2891 TaxID=2989730 RepID=UPI0022221721|nr:hypothetical protein [Novosphingobium sp. KCTC 2891]MCW1383354.1 hypothetical protein [Novosphingobium sp. KCTC 2891]
MQWGLAITALVMALAYPRAGQAAVVIPLAGDRGSALRWLVEGGATLVGTLDVGGAGASGLPMVRVTSDATALAALSQGWLVVAIPSTLCGDGRHGRN